MSKNPPNAAEGSPEEDDMAAETVSNGKTVENAELVLSKKKGKKKAKPEKPGAFRAIKFEWHALRAEMKHVWRMVKRELNYFVNPVDVAIILIFYLIIVALVYLATGLLIPAIIDETNVGIDWGREQADEFWGGTGGRILIGSGGLIVFFVRLVVKS
ncbi:MAG: hypothetical protein ACXADX_14495, partial [Candidatus Hodarchaeales archaeon]